MRISTVLLTSAAAGAALILSTGPASAGEITGNGTGTQGPAHASSICVFSGLQDGDDTGDGIPDGPYGPGVAPQNWGHDKVVFGATPAERKASGFHPGDSCNGHTGFLAGGGEEPPE
jgi:hypothetical protein